MFTGGEVIALFGALLGPLGAAFGALFLAYRKSQTDLLKQKDTEIERIERDKNSQIETLRTDLAEAYRQLFRSVGISARSAQSTATAVEATAKAVEVAKQVQPLLALTGDDATTQGV